MWISSCSYDLVLQVDEPFDGAQTGLRGRVPGRGGDEQHHPDFGVFRNVEVVFAVVAGDRIGLDIDPSVGADGAVVDAPVIAVALGEVLRSLSWIGPRGVSR
ncbi:hypothetical protein GCM10010510_62620 [Streptomyces anandii JCM 4720]|nr:hypothetical protein GCM10010510_62620 [Streptomyces anandii JCM 4720]